MSEDMRSFVATSKFDIGIDDQETVTIFKGEELEFDGVKAIVKGEEKNLPKLRAAKKAGWIQPNDEESQIQETPAQAAGVEMRGATPQQEDHVHNGQTEVADEEQVVHTVADRESFRDTNTDPSTKDVEMPENEREQTKTATTERSKASTSGPHARTPNDKQVKKGGGQQEAQDIGVRFETSTQNETDLSKVGRQSLNRMIRDTEKSVTRKDKVTKENQQTQQQQSQPQNKQARAQQQQQTEDTSHRHAEGIDFENENVGERSAIGVEADQASSQEEGAANPFADDAKVVSSVEEPDTQSSQTPRQEEASRPQREVASESQQPSARRSGEKTSSEFPAKDVKQAVMEQVEDIKREIKDEMTLSDQEVDDALDPSIREGRYRVAKIIHPDLPEWDFSEHWRRKMEIIQEDLADDELALRAVYAAESEAIKKRIKNEFPDLNV